MMIIALSLAAACIATVHDGDTVRLCSGERVRLVNIDAPERRGSPRCDRANRARLIGTRNPAWCDFRRGDLARAALARLIATGPVQIDRIGTDHYGRTLVRLTINGRDAGTTLIALGLARRWQ